MVIPLVVGAVTAAGLGTRLWKLSGGIPKAFFRIKGRPLLWYSLKALQRVGIDTVVISTVPGFSAETEEIVNELGIQGIILENQRNFLGNGTSLTSAIKYALSLDNLVIVSVTDHFLPREAYVKVKESLQQGSIAVIAGDSSPIYVDIEESTKILRLGDGSMKIGKDLAEWQWIDMGLFGFSSESLNSVKTCEKENYTISSMLQCMSTQVRINIASLPSSPWSDIDTIEDYIDLLYGKRREVLEAVLRWLSWRNG
ncbi:MAG: hypothetical protein DRO10_00895 [Thermoprotei archaeon]|nr:MAG: hypothetical protein DRO10_00895 [Thermoprotei archaeon]